MPQRQGDLSALEHDIDKIMNSIKQNIKDGSEVQDREAENHPHKTKNKNDLYEDRVVAEGVIQQETDLSVNSQPLESMPNRDSDFNYSDWYIDDTNTDQNKKESKNFLDEVDVREGLKIKDKNKPPKYLTWLPTTLHLIAAIVMSVWLIYTWKYKETLVNPVVSSDLPHALYFLMGVIVFGFLLALIFGLLASRKAVDKRGYVALALGRAAVVNIIAIVAWIMIYKMVESEVLGIPIFN